MLPLIHAVRDPPLRRAATGADLDPVQLVDELLVTRGYVKSRRTSRPWSVVTATLTWWGQRAGRSATATALRRSRGSIRLHQASGAMWIVTQEGDRWDGLSPEGHRLPAFVVLQKRFDASVDAIGRLMDPP